MAPFVRGVAAGRAGAAVCAVAYAILLCLVVAVPTSGATPSFVVELGPIFSFRGGVYVEGDGRLAGSAALGSSPGLTVLTGRATGFYALERQWLRADWYLEAGVPLVVFDFLEGRYVDRHEYIEHPFFGIAPGAGVAALWRTGRHRRIGVSLSAALYVERQAGAWGAPVPVPVITIRVLPKKNRPGTGRSVLR